MSEPIRVLLVDDEVLGRVALRQALDGHADAEVVGECGNGAEALAALPLLDPDLLFLDIEMPGIDGFGLLRDLPEEIRPITIFVTAHSQHALRAFDVEATDYILKPIDQTRFDQAMAKARALLRSRAEQVKVARGPGLERLSIRHGGTIHVVRAGDIDWVRAEGNYVEIHAAGAVYLHRETLGRLESELDPARFIRIHRSTLVNVERVREIQPLFHGELQLILRDGTALTLSRRFRDRVSQALGLR